MLPPIATIIDNFEIVEDEDMRLEYLIELGKALPPLPEALRTEENRVHGCESQVWLVAHEEQGRWRFAAGSDARLIRGLLALLLVRVEGLSSAELRQLDLPDWFSQLGLGRQLSPSRSNGLNAVLQRMAQLASGA